MKTALSHIQITPDKPVAVQLVSKIVGSYPEFFVAGPEGGVVS